MAKDFILVLISTSAFLSTYYLMMPVLPTHMLNLGIDKLTIGFIMSLFSISSLIIRPFSGIWMQKLGGKKMMQICLIVFCIIMAFINIPGVVSLGIAQILYGISVGMFSVASCAITVALANSEKMSLYMGLQSISLNVAKGAAPALGIIAMKAFGFKGASMFTVIAAIIAFFAILLFNDKNVEMNYQKYNFFTVLLDKKVYLPTLVLLCTMTTYGAMSAMLPVFASERGITGIEYFFLTNTIIVISTRLIIGAFDKKYLISMTSFAAITLTLSFIVMSLVYDFKHLIAAALIYGIGFAVLYPPLASLLVLNVQKSYQNIVIGIFTAGFDLGVALGAFLGGFSKYISFTLLYPILSLIPLLGFFIFRFFYVPLITSCNEDLE